MLLTSFFFYFTVNITTIVVSGLTSICYLQGRVVEWLAHRTHKSISAGSSLTNASNVLGKDMNLVNTGQYWPSRDWQCVLTRGGSQGIDFGCHLHNVNKVVPALDLKPLGDVTRNPKQGYQWPQNWTCECVRPPPPRFFFNLRPLKITIKNKNENVIHFEKAWQGLRLIRSVKETTTHCLKKSRLETN